MAATVPGSGDQPKKRKYGTGSLRWKHGAWELLVRPRRGAAQDPPIRLPGLTREQAEAELELIVAQIKTGRYQSPRVETTSPDAPLTFANLWLLYQEQNLDLRLANKRIGRARYDDVCGIAERHLCPAIGANLATEIDSTILLKYEVGKRNGLMPVADRRAGQEPKVRESGPPVASRTIRSHLTVIGQIYRWAMQPQRALVSFDPTQGLELPSKDDDDEDEEQETQPFELDQVNMTIRLLPAGTERRIGKLVFGAGPRLGEVLGCQESGWDPKKRKLKFRHALKREGGKIVVGRRGKNRAARRTLTLSEPMGAVIDEEIAHNTTLSGSSTHLFQTPAGTGWNPSNFRNRIWYPALYAAYVKLMAPPERERWLAEVSDDRRNAAELLCLEDITVKAVLDARWGDLDGAQLAYTDADGDQRFATLPPDLAVALGETRDAVIVEAHQDARERSRHTGTVAPHADFDDARIFPGKRGQPMKLDQFIKDVFRDPLARAELSLDRRIHRARHTYVSLVKAVEPDITDKEIQKRVGHSNRASTDTYTHTFAYHDDKPADVLPHLAGLDLAKLSEDRRLHQAAALLRMSPDELRGRLAPGA